MRPACSERSAGAREGRALDPRPSRSDHRRRVHNSMPRKRRRSPEDELLAEDRQIARLLPWADTLELGPRPPDLDAWLRSLATDFETDGEA